MQKLAKKPTNIKMPSGHGKLGVCCQKLRMISNISRYISELIQRELTQFVSQTGHISFTHLKIIIQSCFLIAYFKIGAIAILCVY